MNIPEGWTVVDERLMREFEFDTFSSAKTFVDVISVLAEEANHHPEIHFGWGYAVVELFTHDEGRITQKDIDLARGINASMEA